MVKITKADLLKKLVEKVRTGGKISPGTLLKETVEEKATEQKSTAQIKQQSSSSSKTNPFQARVEQAIITPVTTVSKPPDTKQQTTSSSQTEQLTTSAAYATKKEKFDQFIEGVQTSNLNPMKKAGLTSILTRIRDKTLIQSGDIGYKEDITGDTTKYFKEEQAKNTYEKLKDIATANREMIVDKDKPLFDFDFLGKEGFKKALIVGGVAIGGLYLIGKLIGRK